MNNKIAILSMQRIINYGSVLQAYSLREIISDLTGADVDFIDIETDNLIPADMPIKDDVDYNVQEYRKRDPLSRIKLKVRTYIHKIAKQKIKNFMTKELHLTNNNSTKRYDTVVIGSDEVFKSLNSINLQLYGEVKQSDNIITYAASCGQASIVGIPQSSIPKVKKAMNNISAMSVRDEGTRSYVQCLYDGIIDRHLDPVLVGPLQSRKRSKVYFKNYIIVYAYNLRIRTKDEIDAIKAFANKYHLKTISIGGYQWWCDYHLPVSPFRVLDYFYYADYVVTDTFHGAVFSIINNKQFIAFPRRSNENKLVDLLANLSLSERIVDDSQFLEEIMMKKIDYSIVNSRLERERARSKEYLNKYL